MGFRRISSALTVITLFFLLFSCRMETGLSPASKAGLPADSVQDVARANGGTFSYETVLPVALDLTVQLYRQPDPSAALEPQTADGQLIVVSLRNAKGELLYTGSIPSGGTLATVLSLPAAPQDVVLRLESPGYQAREVTIDGMVLYSEIHRVMGLLSEASVAGSLADGGTLADADQDGVPDIYDVDPLDPEVAFQVRTPASGQFTVAFEDLYPVPGDADYNDFVAWYFIQENHKSQIVPVEKEIKPIEVMLLNVHGEATAKAKVAGYSHKFGIVIDFPGITATHVTRTYFDALGIQRQDTQGSVADRAVLWLFENTSRNVTGKTATFDIFFPKGVTRDMISIAPYDPVLYVLNTRRDIHLAGQESLSGDSSSYMDSNGYPWALLVPKDWPHPAETQYIGKAYPLFDEWRASKGAVAPYWYLYPASTGSVEGNSPPYPVTAATANPVLVAGSGSTQQFPLSLTDPKADPDGDAVQFMSSPAPTALQGLFALEAGTGLVSFKPDVPEGDYLFYFWSVDEHGASTITTPFKATFSFRGKISTGYPRIVIETFSPNGSFTANTFIDLFGPNGDPDADNPWTGDDRADALAWDDNGSTAWANMSRIDYTAGLNPGTYYIRVRGNVEVFDEYYAIRVLSLDLGESLPAYPALTLASKPDSVDAVGTGDDLPQSGGVPVNPVDIGLGGALSRSLDYDGAGDIDWFRLVLP